MIDAQEAHRTVVACDDDHATSPVEFFEKHAFAVWSSGLQLDAKAVKLCLVSDAIQRYLHRTQIEIADRARTQDSWANLKCSRATAYLAQLAADLRRLALQCQQEAGQSTR